MSLNKNQLLCSIDLSETGIKYLNSDIFENFNQFILELIKINKNHERNTLKISFSNIEALDSFRLPYLNTVLFIQDSRINKIQPRSLNANTKIELNLFNVTTSSVNWLNLLDSSKLKLLNLRNIPNFNDGFNFRSSLYPITSIIDLKIYNTIMPALDENFFIFKILKYIENIEFVDCSISKIQNGLFESYKNTFRYLKILILTNNNITEINDRTFSGLYNLILLDLDENPIKFIDSKAFNGLRKLNTLSLNNNIKVIDLMRSPQWFINFIVEDHSHTSQLQEINFKNKKWLSNFCLIDLFFKSLLNSSESLIVKNSTKMQHKNIIGSSKSKYLKLFHDDEVEPNYSEDVYCNLIYICKQNPNRLMNWKIEFMNSICVKVFDLVDNLENRCLLNEKAQSCQDTLNGKY